MLVLLTVPVTLCLMEEMALKLTDKKKTTNTQSWDKFVT